jgi:hypothetical protein
MFNLIKKLFLKKEKEEKKKNGSQKLKERNNKSIRKGEIGEYKIDIQLAQLPKDYRYLNDLMIENNKSRTGYSQIDHVVITPYCLFIIETKNYEGEIKGDTSDRYWSVSNKFKMYNPLLQNYGHIKALENILTSYDKLTYISLVSFTMRCRFSINPELRKIGSDQLIVYDTEVSDFIHRKIYRMQMEGKQPLIDNHNIIEIYEVIKNANVTDPSIREKHNNTAGKVC